MDPLCRWFWPGLTDSCFILVAFCTAEMAGIGSPCGVLSAMYLWVRISLVNIVKYVLRILALGDISRINISLGYISEVFPGYLQECISGTSLEGILGIHFEIYPEDTISRRYLQDKYISRIYLRGISRISPGMYLWGISGGYPGYTF